MLSSHESYGHGVSVVAISTAEIRRIREALTSIDRILGRHPAAQIEVEIVDGKAVAFAEPDAAEVPS